MVRGYPWKQLPPALALGFYPSMLVPPAVERVFARILPDPLFRGRSSCKWPDETVQFDENTVPTRMNAV